MSYTNYQSTVPKLRLWLATKLLSPKRGQLGVPLASGSFFTDGFQIEPGRFQMVCPLSVTPSEAISCTPEARKHDEDWGSWQHVLVEVHPGNDLGLMPGYYWTPLEPQAALQAVGHEWFFPTQWWLRDSEMADWNDQRNAYLAS